MAIRRISLGKAVLELDTDIDPLIAGLGKAEKQVKGFGVNTNLLGGVMGQVFGGVTMANLGAKVIQFGANLLATAGRLQDLHERTAISVEALQSLTIVAEQSGSSIDAVATAVFQMGKRLAGGDDNAADAIGQLGLNFTELRNSKPEEAFNVIGKALGALDDPMKRAELGAKIFGRSVDELLPTFVNLNKETGAYLTLSARQVSMLDAMGDAWVRLKASIVPATVATIDWVLSISKGVGAWESFLGIVNPDESSKAFDRMTKATRDNAKAVKDRALVMGQAAVAIGIAEDLMKMAEAEAKEGKTKLKEENKKLTKSLAELKEGVLQVENTLPGLTQNVGYTDDSVMKLGGKIRELTKDLSALERQGWTTAGVAREFNDDLVKLGEHVDAKKIHDYAQEWQFVGPILDVVAERAKTIGAHIRTAFEGLPDLLMKAFTGGGGLLGAFKAFGVQIADAVIGPLMDKMAAAGKVAVGLGASLAGAIGGKVGGGAGAAVGGMAGTLGGAALATGTGLGAAAAAGSITAALALGAATMGIGLAAVGAVVAIKKLYGMIGPSKEEKAAREVIAQTTAAITATMTAAQRAEAAQAGWAGADTLIVVRDGYIAAGRSAAEAEAAVARLWASSQDGGKHTKEIIDEINAVMVEGAAHAAELADAAAAASEAQAAAEAEASAARQARLDEFQARIDEMLARRDALIKSVEKEAPERVMGVIEKAQRAEIASLDKQMADQKIKMGIAADEMAADITDALGKLSFKVKIKGEWDIPDMPHVQAQGMAAGGVGRVTRPTLFLAGEGGPEDFAFSGGNRAFGGGGGSDAALAEVRDSIEALRRDFRFTIPNLLAKATVTAAAKSGQ